MRNILFLSFILAMAGSVVSGSKSLAFANEQVPSVKVFCKHWNTNEFMANGLLELRLGESKVFDAISKDGLNVLVNWMPVKAAETDVGLASHLSVVTTGSLTKAASYVIPLSSEGEISDVSGTRTLELVVAEKDVYVSRCRRPIKGCPKRKKAQVIQKIECSLVY
ncbi:MAG: hypothetical protein AB1540_01895 [Bdellovibrionota bacterium]